MTVLPSLLPVIVVYFGIFDSSDAFCFHTYGTWISRYHYHTRESDVRTGFQALKNAGITRVYVNVWADGYIYARSSTASANGVSFVRDTLKWAVDAGRMYGMEVYAWFEYGTQAHYGSSPTNSFALSCQRKNWLLKTGSNGYNSPEGGSYVYCDVTNAAVRKFFADMTADLVRNYGINGIQYDDHMKLPSGFTNVDRLAASQRYKVMEDFMVQIRNSVKAARRNAVVSYSPSTIDFSRQHHNVDWQNYLRNGVVDEIVPQYYRTSASGYRTVVNQDLYRLHGYQSSIMGGIRLSGSGSRTSPSEVQQMLDISYDNKMKGVSFWFADDIITGSYRPPTLARC